MKQFDIFYWQPRDWPKPHPCVVVSHPDRASRKDAVEVLMCSSKRAARAAESHEIILDRADGLDWPTLCKCDLIHAVDRQELGRQKGQVASERQRELVRTIIAAHGWAAIL
jgi:mRNA-degrading endonuclease toxin of MazEF toxin-antitoxin module